MSRPEKSPTPRFKNLHQAYAWLDAHINFERQLHRLTYGESTFALAPFLRLMQSLGNPHRGIPSVHIAGTRGKGSSALALESILSAAGFRVAVFTSPHIHEYRERIRIAGAPIDPIEFQRMLECAAEARLESDTGASSTFKTVFELLTAVFFLAAHRLQADFLVVETGLGGRLDTTNVLDPGPVLLTRIGLEHTHLLGDSIGAIAMEKAAILKSGGWGVWATQNGDEAPAVFRRRSIETSAPLVPAPDLAPLLAEQYHHRGMTLTYGWEGGELRLDLPLYGPFLSENLQGALAVYRGLVERKQVPSQSAEAIAQALAGLQLPGRMQRVKLRDRPEVSFFLDGAHCPTGASAVARALFAHFGASPAVAVVSMMADKDHPGFFRSLAAWPHWRRVICCGLNSPRSASVETLAGAARPFFSDVRVCPDLSAALELGLQGCESGDTLIALGSILAVGPAFDWSLSHGRT
jgi:dihydrofolate synthase / folylpolyglutamate synthase